VNYEPLAGSNGLSPDNRLVPARDELVSQSQDPLLRGSGDAQNLKAAAFGSRGGGIKASRRVDPVGVAPTMTLRFQCRIYHYGAKCIADLLLRAREGRALLGFLACR
jgi:hypothetical protein